ncbi:MFS transporter [Bdellovibrio bacteriovorus]|uniref:Glycerol-3-phosphate transporter n=1 Tax=Bdellovibrio bacteriovorus (strain ATCC 15356 / DSM 50701 / NCIMB 9529 / HD100) TaxID=264462 RepID=Q6MJ69_BDEBA|nr:MFS transporter [Bdellovibrio bacteriovorus]CAE80692.1 glycerol-3-phosphate transporter [Bdellovibrio bacteriovorus HD100]
MALLLVSICLAAVIFLYFNNNPLNHSKKFIFRRFVNWFPLGMSYAFLYMARYNLNVSKNAMGDMMTKEQFGIIFAAGTIVYGLSFLINGPLVDRIGGKKGIIIATLGSALMNLLMGGATYLYLMGRLKTNMVVAFSVLYALNMFFQSYGAVSIIKVKAYWFHVRERGVFGAIFGTLISFGVYFAFDWGQAIVDASKLNPEGPRTAFQNFIQHIFAIDTGATDATWLVFTIPAFILIVWALIDMVLLKDSPKEANFDELDTADASSGDDDDVKITLGLIFKKVFANPVMITIALVDFTSGVLRNGIMQWYLIFANETKETNPAFYAGSEFFIKNWGLLLCLTGVLGGFIAGLVSDRMFQSRRGPPAAINNFIMIFLLIAMCFFLTKNPTLFGLSAVLMTLAVIGVHSLMSGTAAADFGGKKMTATASGIVDGCVYLGSGLQSLSIGYLSAKNWHYWPLFLIPFAALGLFLALRMWKELPEATKKYILEVEKAEALKQH